MAEFGSPVGSKPVSPPVPVIVGGVMPKGGAMVVVLGGDMVVGGVGLEGGLPLCSYVKEEKTVSYSFLLVWKFKRLNYLMGPYTISLGAN